MKIIFFLLLLSNIVFFLFEFNSVKKLPVQVADQTKQILLLSEVPEQIKDIEEQTVEPEQIVAVDLADNKTDSVENSMLSVQEQGIAILDSDNTSKSENDLDLEIDNKDIEEQTVEPEQIVADDLADNKTDSVENSMLSVQELGVAIPDNENTSKSKNDLDLEIDNKDIEEKVVEPEQIVVIDLADNKTDNAENIMLSVQEMGIAIPGNDNVSKSESENNQNLEIDKQLLTDPIKVTDKAESLKQEIIQNNDKVQAVEKESFCYQLGPFEDEDMLTDWLTKNNIDLSKVTKYKKQKKSETGFLVYYPRADSYEKSKQNIQLLKSKGVTDFWLFRRGELKGHISLGLFVKHSRAKVLKNRFVNKGINVEIMTRYKEEPEWYADILSEDEISSDMLQYTGLTCPIKNDQKQANVTSL